MRRTLSKKKSKKIHRFLFRRQRQSSAPVRAQKNPELQRLKENVDVKRAERLAKQQKQRQTLSSLSISSVPSTGRQNSFVSWK